MHKIIQPDGWKQPKGYSNGVLATGTTLHIAGQIGWNADCVFEAFDFAGQMRQALMNVRDVVIAAGGQPSDLVRLTWYVTDKKEYLANQREIGRVYQEVLGKVFPAMAMVVVAALVEDDALIEIEGTAVLSMEGNS